MEREELIQKLKINEKPFGLLSEEEKELIREIHRLGLLLYYDGDTIDFHKWKLHKTNNFIVVTETYRIAEHYTEPKKSIMISYNVEPHNNQWKFGCINGGWERVDKACKEQHFIGFEYAENPITLYVDCLKYYDTETNKLCRVGDIDRIKSGKQKVVRPIKVWFYKLFDEK